mmetsp:Transcript_2998/g.5772  ORF Transcript_2998/g.5772 Transcript_2998/m.5772 type:complete len:200 (-) Transcript_2998:256-855(-)
MISQFHDAIEIVLWRWGGFRSGQPQIRRLFIEHHSLLILQLTIGIKIILVILRRIVCRNGIIPIHSIVCLDGIVAGLGIPIIYLQRIVDIIRIVHCDRVVIRVKIIRIVILHTIVRGLVQIVVRLISIIIPLLLFLPSVVILLVLTIIVIAVIVIVLPVIVPIIPLFVPASIRLIIESPDGVGCQHAQDGDDPRDAQYS